MFNQYGKTAVQKAKQYVNKPFTLNPGYVGGGLLLLLIVAALAAALGE
jgi:hypothetical protein